MDAVVACAQYMISMINVGYADQGRFVRHSDQACRHLVLELFFMTHVNAIGQWEVVHDVKGALIPR